MAFFLGCFLKLLRCFFPEPYNYPAALTIHMRLSVFHEITFTITFYCLTFNTVDTSPTLMFRGSSTKLKKSFGVCCVKKNNWI